MTPTDLITGGLRDDENCTVDTQRGGRRGIGGGVEDAPVSCGAPALFQESSFTERLYTQRQLRADTSDEFATACTDTVDERVRGAVGVIVVTLPIAVLWVRSDLVVQTRRTGKT